MTINTFILIAFGGNVIVGLAAVGLTYFAMERSPAIGGLTALTAGIGALLVEHRLAMYVAWKSTDTIRAARIASIAGAIVGVAIVILAYRPEMDSDPSQQPQRDN